MKVEYTLTTSHTPEALRDILSDPNFVLPKVFKSIKKIERYGSSYWGSASFMGISHSFQGNVYTSYTRVMYVFQLKRGNNLGSGKLTFIINSDGSLNVSFEYEGWMERSSSVVLKRWLEDFISNLDEEVRLERIKRKV